MKLTHYSIANAPLCPVATSSALSPGAGSPSKCLSNAAAGHLHIPVKLDQPASYIAKPNLSTHTQMKNLNLLPNLNSLKSNLASVRFLVTTICVLTSLFSASNVFGQIATVGTPQTATGTNAVTITKPTGIAVGHLTIATIAYNEDGNGIDLTDVPPYV